MKLIRIIKVPILIAFSSAFLFGSVIQIAAGTDSIDHAVYTAQAGDTVELITDGGVYHEKLTVVINKALTIRAAAGLAEKPTWTCDDDDYMIRFWDDLTLDGIAFDGALGDSLTDVCIRTDVANMKMGYDLIVSNCDFTNFNDEVADNGHAIYGDYNAQADTVIITDCYFAHFREEIIRFKDAEKADPPLSPGSVKYFKVENCTFWDSGDEAIYVEDHDSNVATAGPEFIVNHLTLYKTGSKSIYPKNIDGAVIKNSVGVSSATDEYFCRIYGTNSVVQNCLYFDTPKDISKKEGATSAQLTNILEEVDPWFADTTTGCFKYGWSQLTRFATDKKQIGDTRWGRHKTAPPRVAVNAIGPGTVTYSPVKAVYDTTDVVTFTATPETGAELVEWFGDTLDASGQLTMKAHRYVAAQFALTGDEIVDLNGTFGKVVDWAAVAMELKGTGVLFQEVQHGEVLLASGPDTLTVTTDSPLTLVANDLYLAVMSTKGFSHGHSHNSQVVDTVYGLGLEWTQVVKQRGARNSTALNVYQASGTPSGDGNVSATLHNFPAGLCIALSVVRYSGVEALGTVLSRNILGFHGPVVEITGYPRPDKRDIPFAKPDNDAFSVNVPLQVAGSAAIGFIAHRNVSFGDVGEGLAVRDTFKVDFDGNTNSIALVESGIPEVGIVDEGKGLPLKFSLSQNYPNPFNPTTRISYSVPTSKLVTLEIYNVLGQKVRTLVNKVQNPGSYSVVWDALDDRGSNVSGGVYIYQLRAGSSIATRKMVIVK